MENEGKKTSSQITEDSSARNSLEKQAMPHHLTEGEEAPVKAATGVATEHKLEYDEHKNFQEKNRFDEAVHQKQQKP